MKTARFLVFRALLLITFITTYVYFLFGQARQQSVHVVRNAAWNDLVREVDFEADSAARETLGTELVLVQKFLEEHESEVNVRIYDIAVFRAIDQARARLQQADKDLETIRNELSYKEKEYEARGGR